MGRQPIPEGSRPQRGGPQHIPRPADATPAGPASWFSLPAENRAPSLDQIVSRLGQRGDGSRVGQVPHDAANKQSAVLVPLYEENGSVFMVLTRRASHMRHHQGEVAFPGGRRDPEDSSLWGTAVREAWEETALPVEMPQKIGELDSFVTVSSNSLVQPLVGLLPHRPQLEPSPAEVEHIIHVSLEELLLDEVYSAEKWEIFERRRTLHFFELFGDTVWGATAAMVHQFLSIVTGTD